MDEFPLPLLKRMAAFSAMLATLAIIRGPRA
jgi:hypothetical protein